MSQINSLTTHASTGSTPTHPRQTPDKGFQHKLESLERRQLLSGTMDVADGVLTIHGTELDDSIGVGQYGNQVQVSIKNSTTPLPRTPEIVEALRPKVFENIQHVVIYGHDGNDVISFFTEHAGDSKLIDVRMYGGEGEDDLRGGGGNDLLYGGLGGDWVRGNDGDDQLFGENGSDVIEGGAGDDALYGGNGPDVMIPGDGRDYIDGGGDSDARIGVSDDDVLSESDLEEFRGFAEFRNRRPDLNFNEVGERVTPQWHEQFRESPSVIQNEKAEVSEEMVTPINDSLAQGDLNTAVNSVIASDQTRPYSIEGIGGYLNNRNLFELLDYDIDIDDGEESDVRFSLNSVDHLS